MNLAEMTVGIVGLGNMGGAIRDGLVRSGVWYEGALLGFDPGVSDAQGVTLVESLEALAVPSDVVIVAVKPHLVEHVLGELAQMGFEGTIVSVAAGVPLDRMQRRGPDGVEIVRVMPNTAAAIGASTTAIVDGNPEAITKTKAIFDLLGTTVVLASESLIHAYIGVAGSGPAFAYVFAEALADGAVAEGMHRSDARRLAASMMAGAAALLLADGESPATRKDAVASPGGTTIEGLVALEDRGFRSAAIAAVRAAAAKSREMQG